MFRNFLKSDCLIFMIITNLLKINELKFDEFKRKFMKIKLISNIRK